MDSEKASWERFGEHIAQAEEAERDLEIYLEHKRPWDRLGHILENLVGAFVMGFVIWIAMFCLQRPLGIIVLPPDGWLPVRLELLGWLGLGIFRLIRR